MAQGKGKNEDDWVKDYLSPKDMRQWAEREARNIKKAAELRMRDLEFVTAYERGQIKAEEADDRYFRYHHRWNEALPGINATDAVTNEQILAAIDEAQGPYHSLRTLQQGRGKLPSKSSQRRTR